jgi:hypothetical protein
VEELDGALGAVASGYGHGGEYIKKCCYVNGEFISSSTDSPELTTKHARREYRGTEFGSRTTASRPPSVALRQEQLSLPRLATKRS